mmetsp:Transcript_11885/g.14356  ORF Transcript_11885/g.14356 Transcript_11885/m.14356 type:complete len:90 (-) Transcript_11885:201-470(-)
MSFFSRIASYLGTEILAKKLAENRAFQWFALNTVESVQKVQKGGLNAIKPDAKVFSSSQQKLNAGKKEVSSFGSHLVKAIKKDLGLPHK